MVTGLGLAAHGVGTATHVPALGGADLVLAMSSLVAYQQLGTGQSLHEAPKPRTIALTP